LSGSRLAKFKNLLINLLPKGKLWRPIEQPVLSALLEAEAQELCRIDDRTKQMLLEVDPRTTDETLTDWETVFGLPDECTPEGLLVSERRVQLIQKMTNIGGISKQFYEFIATQLGFPTTVVTNILPFTAGSKAGDALTNFFSGKFVAGSKAGEQLTTVGWRYYFEVELPVTAATVFVAGSFAGDPLRTFANPLIECTIKKLKPAHAGVVFSFVE
jgi:uncharacterized protein YmfQ (DUF2313 family)